MKNKLVSIVIPNYNYGCYLRACLDSVLNQTYDNLEVIFRDNNSTDDSYEIALSYRKKFEEKGIFYSVSRNKKNVGSDQNTNLCLGDTEGEYICVLSSDDLLKPTFVERCASIMNENRDVVMVMTHRDEIDENNKVTVTPSFYNESCIVEGEDQAAVFMMAGIAVPTQRMYRRGVSTKVRHFKYSFQVAGDWFNNFLHACVGDIAYVKDALCQYRVHSGNETNVSEINMIGIFEHYQLINSFVNIATSMGMTKPQKRYGEAVEKLSRMCLRYTYKMLKNDKTEVAKKYMMLAKVFDEKVINEEQYRSLEECWALEDDALQEKMKLLEKDFSFQRQHSYNPPEGFKKIDVQGKIVIE